MEILLAKERNVEDILRINQVLCKNYAGFRDFRYNKPNVILEDIERGFYFIGVENNKIKGVMSLGINGNDFVLRSIAVDENFQKEGIGKKFVERAKIIGVKNSTDTFVVGSMLDYNARSFYENCGFKLGRIKKTVWGDSYEFYMKLT